MGATHIFVFFVTVISVCNPIKIGLGNVKTPSISAEDGHLVLAVPEDKNITLKSSGVLINNIDVLTTLDKAYSASKFLDNYQSSFASTVERIDLLEQRVTGLPVRDNTSNTVMPIITERYISRLSRRVNILQKRVNTLLTDDCTPNPCRNGGTCLDKVDDYFCQCRDGWEGPDCLDDVNECYKFLGTDLGCQNGATCVNKPGTYECVCPVGLVGRHCTRRKADCETSSVELCGHGTCIPQNNPVGYKCICDQGWKPDGANGCIDVDECKLNHPGCSTNPLVMCTNTPGSFTCDSCPQGYTGNGYHCSDIDECAHLNGGCSMNPMVTCVNTQGSRICGLCPPGYSGDGVSCAFRGVCNVNNGGCHEKAQCRDNPRISSSYVECICPVGYTGDGMGPHGCIPSLNPANPCSPNPCLNGDCAINNTSGGYTCKCARSYTGRNCDIVRNPCIPNPCLNQGTCQSNVLSSAFKCFCKNGYVGTFCQSEAQGCGGKISGQNGVLRYPSTTYATYNRAFSCAWTIETNSTQILKITFQKFDSENSTNCRHDWLQIHDGRNSASRSLGRFCGNKLPLGGNISTTHNIIYFWLRSDGRSTGISFQLTWNATQPVCGGITLPLSHGTIESPGSPGEYPSNRDCLWAIHPPFGMKLRFHFFSLVIGNNTDCKHDYLEFVSTTIRDPQIFAKFCNTSRPAPFYAPTGNVLIHFHSDAENNYPGFQLTYVVEDATPGCGITYTRMVGTIQPTPYSPKDRPHNYICNYKIHIPDNLKIKVTFLSMKLQNNNCGSEYVEIHEGPDLVSPLVNRYCGNNLPASYLSYGNQLFISTRLEHEKSNWQLRYETICGGKFVEARDTFEVSNVSLCTTYIYQIERPPGHVIQLSLKISATGPVALDPICRLEYIEIRDGDDENSPLIGKYCKNEEYLINSTHNHLWIKVSRGRLTQNFWQSTIVGDYTSTDIGCGGIIRNKMGNIASPTAPEGNYPGQLKCSWVIIAPPQMVIQITWLIFTLEDSFECAYDNVKVFDNNTDLGMGGLMGKFCGFNKPPILLSSSNIVTIVLTTDITIHMDGFLAAYVVIPESNVCGGNYFTSAGVMISPKYPGNYPINKECTWTITVPQGQQIMLNITDFNVEEQADCNYDSLEIRNGGSTASPLIGKFCGKTIPKLIPSHTNQMYIFFKSDQSRTARGFKLNWFSTATGCGGILKSPTGSIMSPHYPEPYSRNTDCTWKIIINAGSKIQVVFSDINLEKHNQCLADYVQLFDGLTTNSKSLGKFCFDDVGPIVTSGNHMLVKFRSDVASQGRGFQLHYSTVCNNTLKGYRGIIESPNFPNDYPQDQNCVWDIKVSDRNKINITFSHFDLENSLIITNKSCTFDYVEIKYAEITEDELENSHFVRQGKYCGADNPGLITVDSDHAQIHFVTDKVLLGSGFRLEWQIFGCGGILTHNSGTIESPNYPNGYPPAIKCEWQIQVEYGHSIQLEFHKVDVEKISSCEYDWIQVYNGPDNTYNVLTKICQQIKPVVVTSTGNLMFIEFQSDSSYQGKGFTANYTTIDSRCGGRFTAPSGSIFTPNYPNNYNSNDTCGWLIEIEENHSILLQFKDVDLFQNCDDNYVKVFDGPTAAYPILEKVCDNGGNSTVKSTFNEMYIEFRAHDLVTTKGFMAKYWKSCGSRITTQGSGTIQVHREEFTDENINCTWTIVSTDPSRHVSLTITHMQEQVYYCDTDNIKIFNGETTDSPLLGSYCNSKTPPTMVSDGSAITISLENEMDFFATYSVFDSHCGGTFTAVDGYFATPGYPKKYPSDTQCEWTLKVATGNHITLSFIDFDILDSEKCNTDYLEIRKYNVSGSLLGVYCGKNKPTNLTHEGSLWMMYKSSKITAADSNTITAKGFYGEFELNDYNELSGPKGVIESPLYPDSFNGYGTFSWKITVGTRKRILLSFKEFYMETSYEEDDCYFTSLEIFNGVDDTAPLLKTLCGFQMPDPIRSVSNILFIRNQYTAVRMGSKFVLEWLEVSSGATSQTTKAPPIDGCGSEEVIDVHSSRDNALLISPGYPGGYKPNLDCEWIYSTVSRNHLAVHFIDLDLKGTFYKTCIGDYIGIYQKHSYDNEWQLIEKICHRDGGDRYIQGADLLKITFVTNRFVNGTGFKAKIYEVCGGSMSEPTGYIIFNNSTARSHECQWNITVRSGRTIKLTFEDMDIARDHTDGCDNYLMIKNGKFPDSPILGNGKYCGTEKPAPLETTGNYLYLKYTGTPNIAGFKLKYQEVSIQCGEDILLTLFDRSTEISSVNYPNIPVPHTECIWVIQGPPGDSLRIDFEERFDLTYHKNCEVEYVEVRDGGTVLSPLVGRFCSKAPSTQFSTDNIMFIKFFTDTDDPRNGFKAKISLAYCGGTVRGISGNILAPAAQFNTVKRNCTWHIVGPVDHYLNIWFTEFNVEGSISILEPKQTFANETLLGSYSGPSRPVLISTSSNEAIVNYIGDDPDKFQLKFNASQATCGGTLKQVSGTIESPGYPLMNHLNRTCSWFIEVPEGRRVTMQVLDLDLDKTIFRHDQGVAVFDGDTYLVRLVHLMPGTSMHTLESSSNKMKVLFWSVRPSNHRGFKATFDSNKPTICTGDFSRYSGVITQPVVRNNSYWCHWKHNTNVYLNQTLALSVSMSTNFSKTYTSESCTRGFIAISTKDGIISKLCRRTLSNHIVRSPFLLTQLEALISNHQMNFTVNYTTHNCGGIVKGERGLISSPDYPNKPSDTVECSWLLNVDKGQTINLTTLAFTLGSDCEKNFLSIHNGNKPTHPSIGTYCHNNKPETIISQSSSLWIEYHWDKQSTGTGFFMKYEAIAGGCGGIFHDKDRTIQTPNYANEYPNNAECLWEIRADNGYSIQLQFIQRFHIEDSENCKNDYVEILDWQGDAWVSLGKKCGRHVPSDIKSTQEKMRLLFRSNNNITGGGFKAKWKWQCGGTFEATKTTRYIVSPGYPVAYASKLNCVYNITTKTEVLNIQFEEFDLETGSSDCIYDNLTIGGKYFSVFYNDRHIYCGTNKPPFLRIRGNAVIIFKTDAWMTKKGFKFLYREESCGGEIKEPGIIELPAFRYKADFRYFRDRIKCKWTITAPTNQVAIIRINTLRMVLSSLCYSQSLQIYNTFNENRDSRLALLCGELTDGQPLVADSGKMLVKLEASPFHYEGFAAVVYFSHGPAEGCGGTIHLNETKYIESPNLENLDCSWKIIAQRDYQIQIQFTVLNIPNSCSGNNTFVFCSCSFIEVRDGGGPMSELIEKLCSSSNSDHRKITTSWNMAFIRFMLTDRQNNAFKATLTPVLSKCGPSVLNVTQEIKTLTSPNYPNSYPPDIKCNWIFNSVGLLDNTVLHFVEFDLADEANRLIDNSCSGDKIEIIEDPSSNIIREGLGPNAVYNKGKPQIFLEYNNAFAKHSFCGKEETPSDYYFTEKTMVLSFQSLNTQTKGKGFKIEYSTAGCNRNYTSVQGRITNGNSKSKCTFMIIVPENRTISLYFQRLFIPYTSNCSETGIEIRESGPTGKELLRSCGYGIPNPVFSYTNRLYVNIYFRRVPSILKYDISYLSNEKGRGCGGQIYNYKGVVSSPLYPNEFRNETVCEWIITVPVSLHAVLKFTQYDIQGDCEKSYVTVITYSEGTAIVHKFCKDDRPAIMRSNSRIDVVYSSSIHNGGSGWLAIFQGVAQDTTDIK